MSESGQERRFERQPITSGLPRTPDISAPNGMSLRCPIAGKGMRGRLMSFMGSRENSDVQLAAVCNGTMSVRWVPPVDSCLVNSAPS